MRRRCRKQEVVRAHESVPAASGGRCTEGRLAPRGSRIECPARDDEVVEFDVPFEWHVAFLAIARRRVGRCMEQLRLVCTTPREISRPLLR